MRDADEALAALLAGDPGRDDRQAGIVDARGRGATHTGASCMAWAGGRIGAGYAAQGNILSGAGSSPRWRRPSNRARRSLADRLLQALAAGDAAGGDRRGRQSAAIAVVAPRGGYGGNDDSLVDLRVDDHPNPVGELRRLYEIHVLLNGTTPESEMLPLEGDLAEEVRELLARAGYPSAGGCRGPARRAARVRRRREPRGALVAGARLDPSCSTHLRSCAEG